MCIVETTVSIRHKNSVLSCFSRVQLCDAMVSNLPGSSPCNSKGKNTGMGCHGLPQGTSQPRDQTCLSYVPCIGRRALYH